MDLIFQQINAKMILIAYALIQNHLKIPFLYWEHSELKLAITSDQDCGQVVVRLCDVSPSGSSKRISYGVLNLAMRNGLDSPKHSSAW